MPKSPPAALSPWLSENGGKGIRTPGLFIANEALYQLSYTPFLNTVCAAGRDYQHGKKGKQGKSPRGRRECKKAAAPSRKRRLDFFAERGAL